jgi:hypothetical protein
MNVFIVFFRYVSEQNGGLETDLYLYKSKEKAVKKANELHDKWYYHNNDNDTNPDPDSDEDWEPCDIRGDPIRYGKCSLKQADIWIVPKTLDLDNGDDLLLNFNVKSII